MGIKRFFKNKIKDYNFIRNKRKLSVNHFDLDFFKSRPFNFTSDSDPLISIIIIVDQKVTDTLNCLYTIAQGDEEVSKEIILVNKNPSEDLSGYLKNAKGLTIINASLDLIKDVNKAITRAAGKYICLLDQETEVQKNFLSSLLEVFKAKENVGAVGSKIVDKDSNIDHAGYRISKDSQFVPVGKRFSIDTPEFNFLRKVDFCVGSLLFSRLDKNGGINLLDEKLLDVHSAQADFCLRVKLERDLDVFYQPFSEVVRLGDSDYSEIFSGEDQVRLTEKYISNYKNIGISKNLEIYIGNNFKKPSFLFLEENMPKPDQDSGSRRFFEILKILQRNNHHLILAVKHYDESTDRIYVDFFRGFGVQVCVDYVSSQNKIKKVADQVIEAIKTVHVIWIFRPLGFDYWYDLIRDKVEGKKIVYDMVDLHYLRMERENSFIEVSKNREKEIALFKDKEYAGMHRADAVISISDEEKKIVSANGIEYNKIFTVSNIHKPVESATVSFSDRKGLLFIGGYNHLPNIDAVKFLFNEIMPKVWEKDPSIQIFIVGPDFPEDLKLKYHSDRFVILGFQESVDFWFENSRVFVAPLRYGAGVKGKIGQALEYKLPVITTSIGAEGMGLEDQKTALISDENSESFAHKILELYHNENLWKNLHLNSTLPLSKFSIEAQEENIKKMLNYFYDERL